MDKNWSLVLYTVYDILFQKKKKQNRSDDKTFESTKIPFFGFQMSKPKTTRIVRHLCEFITTRQLLTRKTSDIHDFVTKVQSFAVNFFFLIYTISLSEHIFECSMIWDNNLSESKLIYAKFSESLLGLFFKSNCRPSTNRSKWLMNILFIACLMYQQRHHIYVNGE